MNGEHVVDWRAEWRPLAALSALFLVLFFLPVGSPRFDRAVVEGLLLAREYARQHVLLCLVPAFFIAGGIAVLLSTGQVLRYLGPRAPKPLAYGVAATGGLLLAVCSCTVLPLFAGIHRRGAGLGPATAFLYAGPAINVLAITLTASVLGWQLGLARAVGAVLFAVVVGSAMAWIFRTEQGGAGEGFALPEEGSRGRLGSNGGMLAALVALLVFANWARPAAEGGLWWSVYQLRWWLAAAAAVALVVLLAARLSGGRWKLVVAVAVVAGVGWVTASPVAAFAVGMLLLAAITATAGGELEQWLESSWGFAKQIVPLLFAGVLVAGVLLGRPGGEGLIPSTWVSAAVGGSSLAANLIASLAGSLMYFATLTEVPIVQGLLANGMGPGPALALLLAGPALSLPNMLVIASVLGWRKTSVYVALVVVMSTFSGVVYGALVH